MQAAGENRFATQSDAEQEGNEDLTGLLIKACAIFKERKQTQISRKNQIDSHVNSFGGVNYYTIFSRTHVPFEWYSLFWFQLS